MTYKDIKSHEDACRVLEKNPAESTNIHDHLDDIADAINRLDGNYQANFKDEDQQKWRPFFYVDASGFRFGASHYVLSLSLTAVGSRLCCYFRSREASDYFGKQFEAMHKECFFKRKPVVIEFKSYKDLKSHDDACRLLDLDPESFNTTDQKITNICKALNKISGFKPDWNNEDQLKWRPYFRMDASGFRFVFSYCGSSLSTTAVGSRLCHYVGSEEEADYMGQQFIELHKEHYFGE